MGKRNTNRAFTRGTFHRPKVMREERVGPTPETAAKLRPWPMNKLLADNRLAISQYEAAIQIVDAFDTITKAVGHKPLDLGKIGTGQGEIGAHGERSIAVYVRWGNSVQGFVPEGTSPEAIARIKAASLGVRAHVIVEMIKDERSIEEEMIRILAIACSRWEEFSRDYDREQSANRQQSRRHTIMDEAAFG